jgi:SpoVK/Ycf46/Vps4 family AAA+-type ATPase
MTTNRLENIDAAFHSRIHVTVQYPSLSIESRRHIWRTFLGADHPIGAKDLDRLAKVSLNGRQIKNILKTANMLARSEGKQGDEVTKGPAKDGKRGASVEMRHLETILAIERGSAWE